MRYLILIIPITFIFVGCSTPYYATYDIGMEQVERPADIRERYGEAVITKQEGDSTKYVYADSLISIGWFPHPMSFYFVLENKTQHTMRIMWDQAAFVSPNGNSMRIIHSGVKYIDKDKSQPPTVVVRGGSVTDLVYPSDYVEFVYSSWEKRPIFQPYEEYTAINLEPARNNIGETVQVLLPIEIEGNINEYIFTFRVNDVTIPKQRI